MDLGGLADAKFCFFSEYGHVECQFKESSAYNNMSAVSLPLHSPRPPIVDTNSYSFSFLKQSKKDGRDQESIQSSTTPDPRYNMEK